MALCSHAWSETAHARKAAEGTHYDTGKERIGGLRLGLPEREIPGIVTCAPNKLKETYEGATGDYVQTWKYPECGLVLKMSSAKRGGAKQIAAITLTPSEPARDQQGFAHRQHGKRGP